jgi:hypothetical protein
MRYLTVGYYVICLSPLLSIFFYFSPKLLGRGSCGYLGLQTLVIFVQVCGVVLYVVGHRTTELSSKTAPYILSSGILLILWGLFITWYVITAYDWMLRLYSYKMDFTFCGQGVYVAEGLKGLLWIASGLMLTVTHIIHEFRRSKDLTESVQSIVLRRNRL